jgi:hypothetical protein
VSAAELLHQLSRLGVVATATSDGFLDLEPAEILTPELLETIKAHKAELLEHLATANTRTKYPEPRDTGTSARNLPGSLERLPFELESLVRAASSDSLPTSAKLETGIVPDLNRYVQAWACVYLTGNQSDALARLWVVWQVWRGYLERKLN